MGDMLNTCRATTEAYHIIAYYSHLVPVALAFFLSVYALLKTQYSKLSVAFFVFTLSFSAWLIGDLVVWTSPDYDLVYFFWSWLDLTNIIFFVLGSYFFGMLAHGNVLLWKKYMFVFLCIPAFLITATGHSVEGFTQSVCEAINNNLLTNYKLFAEAVAVLLIFHSFMKGWRGADRRKKIQLSVIFLALLAFFGVFSSTEYIASTTGVYEINLYGLFVLPVFLIVVVFAVANLGVFNLKLLGTQVLSYGLIVMAGSQLLFIQDSTQTILSIVTVGMSVIFALLLLQNAEREELARKRIVELAENLEDANGRLRELDRQKTEFVSIASHQLRSPLSAVIGYLSLVLEGSYGPVPKKIVEPIERVFGSARTMSIEIDDFLNVTRIEEGRMRYQFERLDMVALAKKITETFALAAEKRTIGFKVHLPKEPIIVIADRAKLEQIITNLLDNALKYTLKGKVEVRVSADKKSGMALCAVSDTGIGIAKSEQGNLFKKFIRASNANSSNVHGTGLGLYIAREMARAHHGDIVIASDGMGLGSTFTLSVPIAHEGDGQVRNQRHLERLPEHS